MRDQSAPAPPAGFPHDIPQDFIGAARPLTGEAPWREAAAALGCETAAIRAVAEVETRGAAFLPSGRPAILFERHVFRRLTEGRFDAEAPEISARLPGGYGKGGEGQYARLRAALALDRAAALKSASWGRFQIMGFNAEAAGFSGVEPFVAAMCESEAAHLFAFVAFVRAKGLDRALRARDWAGFARGYNGPDFARHAYDRRLAEAWARLSGAAPFTVASVREAQIALAFLGADPGPIDGIPGPRTRAAIEGFERQCRLPVTGRASPALSAALQAVYYALGGPEDAPLS